MKKIIFLLSALSMTGGVLLAQEKGTAVPPAVQQCFNRDYTSIASVTWRPLGDNWYNGVALDNGRTVSKSCDMDGAGAIVALPVKETYIPEDILSSLAEKYGPSLYDVSCIKGDQYLVRIIKNGRLKIETDSWSYH